jgi:hypothetical protein
MYVAIAVEVVNPKFVFSSKFGASRQESASNPLLHIHANRYQPYKFMKLHGQHNYM